MQTPLTNNRRNANLVQLDLLRVELGLRDRPYFDLAQNVVNGLARDRLGLRIPMQADPLCFLRETA